VSHTHCVAWTCSSSASASARRRSRRRFIGEFPSALVVHFNSLSTNIKLRYALYYAASTAPHYRPRRSWEITRLYKRFSIVGRMSIFKVRTS
jgi:hypothetical protein